jgi:hypothetical protein
MLEIGYWPSNKSGFSEYLEIWIIEMLLKYLLIYPVPRILRDFFLYSFQDSGIIHFSIYHKQIVSMYLISNRIILYVSVTSHSYVLIIFFWLYNLDTLQCTYTAGIVNSSSSQYLNYLHKYSKITYLTKSESMFNFHMMVFQISKCIKFRVPTKTAINI